MINPKNSLWNKPKKQAISRYPKNLNQIVKTVTRKDVFYYDNNLSTIVLPQLKIYLTKDSMKFRLKGHLDWAYYTDQSLSAAIDNDCVEVYYEIMLDHIKSDPNLWKHTQFEDALKIYYSNRAGNAFYYSRN